MVRFTFSQLLTVLLQRIGCSGATGLAGAVLLTGGYAYGSSHCLQRDRARLSFTLN